MYFKVIYILLFSIFLACNNNIQVENEDKVNLYFRIENSDSLRLDESAIFNNFTKRENLFSFIVGRGEVIKGWDSLIVGCKKNILYTFKIPAYQAYGNENIYHDIPANSDLTLTFEIVNIIKHEKK